MKQAINLLDIETRGDLLRRLLLNSDRMNSADKYGIQTVFRPLDYDWEGDWEGRTILALVSLTEATKKQQDYLEAIIIEQANRVNKFGYFGKEIDLKNISEQQLSGNSWFLRGLCAYYRATKNEKIFSQIKMIMESLYNNLSDAIDCYPSAIPKQIDGGGKMGSIVGKYKDWKLSTDVGCFFITLDGMSDAYGITRDEKTKIIIEKLIEKFDAADKLTNNYQTHATLTATRGIMTFYEITGEQKYLNICRKELDNYMNNGMTLNYANYNWFGRSEWTEPCGIFDSYILAYKLYYATDEPEYMEFARKIYYNAVVFAQRSNGGFGCDKCAIPASGEIQVDFIGNFEAYWCCTMRGGEGLNAIARSQYCLDGDDIYVNLFNESTLEIEGKIKIEQLSDYPKEESARFVFERWDTVGDVYIYIPCGAKVKITKQSGITVTVGDKFIKVTKQAKRGELGLDFEFSNIVSFLHGAKVLMRGERILAERTGEPFEHENFEYNGKKYCPIVDISKVAYDKVKEVRQNLIYNGD